MLSVLILPVIVLGFLQLMSLAIYPNQGMSWAEFSPFHPFSRDSIITFMKVPILFGLALLLGSWAEKRRILKANQSGVIL
jgi:hypothetical protein